MDPSTYSFFDIEIADGIAVLRVAGADARGYRRGDLGDLMRVGSDLSADERVRVALITGTGRVFSGGLEEDGPGPGAVDAAGRMVTHERARAMVHSFVELDKPVVVALNGPAAVPALTLALLSDVVVAEEHARFQDPHVATGWVSATGPFIWPLSTGLLQAKRYILTGDPISASEAHRIGLVTEVVAEGASFDRAMEYATNFAACPNQRALRLTKRALNQWLRSAFAPVFEPALSQEIALWHEPSASLG